MDTAEDDCWPPKISIKQVTANIDMMAPSVEEADAILAQHGYRELAAA